MQKAVVVACECLKSWVWEGGDSRVSGSCWPISQAKSGSVRDPVSKTKLDKALRDDTTVKGK